MMSQTDKDIHEMTRRINDISNSLKTLNTIVAKLVGEIREVARKLPLVECNDDAKITTVVEPCYDATNEER